MRKSEIITFLFSFAFTLPMMAGNSLDQAGTKAKRNVEKRVSINENIFSGSKEYIAKGLLDADNTISNDAYVEYKSYEKITLKKGFKVSGAKFKASKINSNSSSASLRTLRLNEENIEGGNNEVDLASILVTVSPNPTTGNFTIDFGAENEEGNSVKISDISGKVVFEADNLSQTVSIDLSGKAKGVYFIQTISNGKANVQKIILK
ncbi:MAG: T9SS type A sorting domain-containing protein [Paludibacteraceae bacterium]|nr:T9SS type A sorting domain-containing protein [Paludibacteraceae bacterium]